MISSKISVPVSTGNARGLIPFWNEACLGRSRRLWLPTETAFAGSPSNCSRGSFKNVESGSWFSTKEWVQADNASLPTICSPSSTFSTVESTAAENTKKKQTTRRRTAKPKPNASIKVRIRPDAQTLQSLNKWFGCARLTYNWALSELKNKHKKLQWWKNYDLRTRFVTRCNIPKKYAFLHEDTPKHVREGAINDLCDAYRTNFEKKKQDPRFQFDVAFRSGKGDQSIVIPMDAFKPVKNQTQHLSHETVRMYPTYLTGIIEYHIKSKAGVSFEHDCRLTKDKLGRLHLHIPIHRSSESQAVRPKKGCVALDPGVRTFVVGYSPDGTAFSHGDRDISRVQRLCQHLDDLISRTESAPKQHRWRMKRAIALARMRIHNLVTEVHCKVAKYLTSRYDEILIPSFRVSDMVKRGSRRIRKKTVRQMICWRHYAFRQRLIQTGLREGVKVIVCTEEYTSKTCTNCGHLHRSLGSNKVFKCPMCDYRLDRDLNGARNIFLKNVI